jgi:nitrogen regulatory protein P-II 1
MHLLVAVVNQPEKLDEILSGFVELGVRGATVINSEGMGRVLSHDIPIFAGLQTLIDRSRPHNRTIFTVLSDELVEEVIVLFQDICGDLEDPATGILFTLPLDRVVGLSATELGEAPAGEAPAGELSD